MEGGAMKPEKQRTAIAQSCGWCKEVGVTGIQRWRNHRGELCDYLPDYCEDLNAMHEAERTLAESLQGKYLDNLYSVCNSDSMYNDKWKMNRAIASQRAEAFLKTIGEWEGVSDE